MRTLTREWAKELLPIIQALVDRKAIQYKTSNHLDWVDTDRIDLTYFCEGIEEYRIKPEPTYRPFKNTDECWQEMQKHQPFGWVTKGEKHYVIKSIESGTVFIDDDCENRPLVTFFKDGFTFADGKPFGIMEER